MIKWSVDYKNRNNFIFGGSVEVGCSSKELWDLLATRGHLLKVHPLLERHESEKWLGIGSKDFLTYKDGGKRVRTILEWNVGKSLRLKVENQDAKKESFVTYEIKQLTQKNNCELLIQIETAEYKNIPRPFWKLYARKFLVPQYKQYLQGVLLGFENYKPVTKTANILV